ncbi:restriction endonuclease subunit S [Streptomyces sp. LBUM 1478]|uniref:restriction endonuclease subunit S n=1 Tax=Streptomyces scabiei TaxID=1930 RepID=UPI00099ECC9B|nr:restriction endonuclease subunit S [Streptomyces scabiei]MBP5905818.1 restriction endonuclease subunit S [Streptomyces sp. LBUM 1478]
MSDSGTNRALPQGWARGHLRDVLITIEAGKSFTCEPRPAEDDEWGVIKVSAMTWGRFQAGENKAVPLGRAFDKKHEIRPGDILVSRANTREYVGAPVLVRNCRPKLLLSDKSLRLVPSTEVDTRWLLYLLSSPGVRKYISDTATGTKDSMRNISQQALLNAPIDIPPLAEQQRIVDVIEDHLSRLNAAETLIERCSIRLRRLRDTVSNPTFGYTVDVSADAAAPPVPVGTMDGDLPRVPRNWHWCRLEDVAEVVGGVTKDSKKQSDPDLPEVPYLRVANVQRGRLNLDQISVIRVPAKKAEALALEPGDVLLNEGGDRDKLGRGWVWEGQIPGAIHQNHVFRARVRAGAIDPKIMSWYANSSGRWFERNGKQSVNLASISLSKIKKFPLPVPPEAEQKRIVERIEDNLSVMDNVTALIARSRLRSASLRRALLARAFSGQLVHQDSNDESANVMLTRVAAEREAATAKPARRRASQRTRTAPAQQEFDV